MAAAVSNYMRLVVRQSYNPLQIILEILRDLGNQMCPVHAVDVVVVTGIDEVVFLHQQFL